MSVWATFLLVIAIWQNSVIFCLFVCFSLCCPLSFQRSPDPNRERVYYSVETSSWLPPWDGYLSQILCLFFHHYLLSYFISKRLACLSGYLGSSASIQKFFFVEVASHEDDLLTYLWGRKWSPDPIPLPSLDRPLFVFLILSYMRSLYMLDINPLSLILFEIIYSHSVNCLHFVNGFLYCVKGFKFN